MQTAAQAKLWRAILDDPFAFDAFYPEEAFVRLVDATVKYTDISVQDAPRYTESQSIAVARSGQRLGMRYVLPTEHIGRHAEHYQGLGHEGPYFFQHQEELRSFSAWHPPTRYAQKVVFVHHRDEDDQACRMLRLRDAVRTSDLPSTVGLPENDVFEALAKQVGENRGDDSVAAAGSKSSGKCSSISKHSARVGSQCRCPKTVRFVMRVPPKQSG